MENAIGIIVLFIALGILGFLVYYSIVLWNSYQYVSGEKMKEQLKDATGSGEVVPMPPQDYKPPKDKDTPSQF